MQMTATSNEPMTTGWKGLLQQALKLPYSSVVLMGLIAVLGLSTGLITHNTSQVPLSSGEQLDMGLPEIATSAFKTNKYDNANLSEEDPTLEEVENKSLEEKVQDNTQGFGTNEQWQSREQVTEHFTNRMDEQLLENQQHIEHMGQPAELSSEELAERRARDEALERAARLERNAQDQLLSLQQPNALPPQDTSQEPATSEDQVAQVSLVGVEDYIDYQAEDHRPMNAFYGLRGERIEPTMVEAKPVPNAIEAVVHGEAGEVTVTDGSTLKLRLLQDIQVDKYVLPKNSLLTGECFIRGERVQVVLSSVRVQSSIMPISLRVYDLDGHAGIYIPDMALKSQVAQTGSQALSGGGGSLNMPYMVPTGGSVGEMVVGQTAAQGVGMAVTGLKSVVTKKISQPKATIRPNHKIYLKQE